MNINNNLHFILTHEDFKDYIIIDEKKIHIYLGNTFFSKIGYFFKKHFSNNLNECFAFWNEKNINFLVKKEKLKKSDILNLMFKQQKNQKIPKKSYQSLGLLEENHIPYLYTPFDQGALVNILSENWLGACNHLSHNWLIQKILSKDFENSIYYAITDSHLPHPLIYDEKSIEQMQAELKKFNGNQNLVLMTEGCIEAETNKTGVNAFCDIVANEVQIYGLVRVNVLMEDSYYQSHLAGHVMSFAKKGKMIAWFDPNYGEIFFNNFDNFKFWLENETLNGSLKYFILDESKIHMNLRDYFPQPEFSEEEKGSLPIAGRLIERRQRENLARAKIKATLEEYSIEFFSIE